MAALIWNHDCTVGIRSIDDQHGILLDALNELRTALLMDADSQTIRPMLKRVSELMRMHGESEDRLLAQYGFPDLASHRVDHQRLLNRLVQFDTRFEQRQRAAAYELVEYLRKWFTTHTGISGKKYGPWLQQCGVQ
ncbi:bacteriohemerythrin [Acidicapsa dinghuensis]|uniref:Bacteriohemerythrin n=1 Tax=Acidicapsa dinghuensis TaxID=2218256 RepID=A0ABW1EL63_9BACT|nr:bacteriohemerythrin [Acidicapsa dinghuensis]